MDWVPGASDLQLDVKMSSSCFGDIIKLAQGQAADERQIHTILDFIDARYDCADFRMVCVLRSLYDYADLISGDTLSRMQRTVLHFKYAMDEPGEDSMCYWSENHQLLFAACEYLAGQLYPGQVFTNNGATGATHRERARRRLIDWLHSRLSLGFVEWHSNTYYEEDAAPLSLLIDLAEDKEIVAKATMLMDLLLLDMALHSFQGYFCAASGRCYEAQKKDPNRQNITNISIKAFGLPVGQPPDYTHISADFLLNRTYQVPPVLREIARSADPITVLSSMGLDVDQVAYHFPDQDDISGRGMYLWSMEAFTTPASIRLTMRMFRAWSLITNGFLKDLKRLSHPWLRMPGILPLIIRVLNPVTQGVAIQRGNTYTRRTRDYLLSTAQAYHPGGFGDQQHIWQATLNGGVTVFTTHPGVAFFDDNARNFSPGYWVGNGVNPHAQQYGHVCLCLYNLNVRKGLMEKPRQQFTHAWFPQEQFDQVAISSRLALGRKGRGYIALFTARDVEQRDETELIQKGRVTGWAAVMGSAEEETFPAFCQRMRACRLELLGCTLSLTESGHTYGLTYKRGMTVDGVPMDIQYPRLDSPYGAVPRLPDEWHIACNGQALHLRLTDLQRTYTGAPT